VTGPASEAIAYPVLDDSQQARLRRCGTVRRVTAGEILYSPADDSCDLLVVLGGEVVVSNDALGRSVELARHGSGHFAGELNMLTGQRPFLTARAATEGWVLALTPAQVREVLARETDVADILLRALIARRRRHVSGAVPGAAIEIIGTSHSGSALALRTFLNRNTIAYQWVDVDQSAQAAGILGGVGATMDDLPVVITPTRVLMNAASAALAAVLGRGRYPAPGGAMTWWSSAPGPPDWRQRCTAPRRVSTSLCWTPPRQAARPARARASRTTSASPTGYPARS
jgi:thioredoxin reductase (NADPH)